MKESIKKHCKKLSFQFTYLFMNSYCSLMAFNGNNPFAAVAEILLRQ